MVANNNNFSNGLFSHPKLVCKLTTFLHFKCQFSKEISYNPFGKQLTMPKFT